MIANIQRTLTSLQQKAQPKLDAARYKAEAGLLPRRGYVHHGQRSMWVEEGEEGLMPRAQGGGVGSGKGVGAPGESDGGGVDMDGGLSTDTDEEEPSEEEKDRERRIKAGWDKGTQDNLKWPAGEGWKPLQ